MTFDLHKQVTGEVAKIIFRTIRPQHTVQGSRTAFECTQAVCVSVLDACASAGFTLVQLFARGWPWGSAPCRHGSSSQFHCHSRMESAPGWEKTNTESSRVIHDAARDRGMARGGGGTDRQSSIFHFNGCLPPHVQPPHIMLIFRRFCPEASPLPHPPTTNRSCVFPTLCHNTVENIYFLHALCWTRVHWMCTETPTHNNFV